MPQKLAVEQSRKPRKVHGLQGPIDDAFTAPFLCVRATGQPWSDRVDEYAAASLKRFQSEWAKKQPEFERQMRELQEKMEKWSRDFEARMRARYREEDTKSRSKRSDDEEKKPRTKRDEDEDEKPEQPQNVRTSSSDTTPVVIGSDDVL